MSSSPVGGFVPSLVVGEILPPSRRPPFAVARLLERTLDVGFFRRFEVPVLRERAEADAVREIVTAVQVPLTCWVSERLAEEKLNLSALDESERRRAVDRLTTLAAEVAYFGADSVGLLSGPDPGPAHRVAATGQLARSLVELGHIMEREFGLRLVLEPLDREAHKKGLIGPTAEAVQLVRRVREESTAVYIGWDSGHMLLNGEDVVRSLEEAAAVSAQIHFSNPVTDRASRYFGDHHYAIGVRGDGTIEQFRRILQAARSAPLPFGARTSVAVEVKPALPMTAEEAVVHCQDVLQELLTEKHSPEISHAG